MMRAPPYARPQKGQSLVLALVLVGALSIAFLRYYAAGQVVASKSRQLHALDAASFSAALVQARALNMLAYLNRAQVGHHVAMGHLSALAAWGMLGHTQGGQLLRGNPPVHLIGMQFGIPYAQAYTASALAHGQGDILSAALMRAHQEHDRVLHHVLQLMQTQIVATLPDARMHALRSVLRQNYDGAPVDDAALELRITDDQWPGYLIRQSGRHVLQPFIREVAGLYDFLSPRNVTRKNPWPVSSRCPWKRHELRRRGTTVLDDAGHWQSLDTLSFHAVRSNRWIGCYFREYPMAWAWVPEDGGAPPDVPHVENPPDDFSDQDFWRWVQGRTDWDIAGGSANPLANSRAVAEGQAWPGMGLGFHYDVNPVHRHKELRFDTLLSLPGPDGVAVTTRSAARTFFSLPPAEWGRHPTHALPPQHLFFPYWQAALAEPAGTRAKP